MTYYWGINTDTVRKPNPDRMRRYIARTTPDKITGYFDMMFGDYATESRQWFEQFGKRMQLKHKNHNIRIELIYDDISAHRPGEGILHARVVR